MKIIEARPYNSNNAWGFGGGIGTAYEIERAPDEVWIVVVGTAHYRHLPSHKFLKAYRKGSPGKHFYDLHEAKSCPRGLPEDVFNFARNTKQKR